MGRGKLCVGIDVGASSVKLCQLTSKKKGYALQSFGLVPLPSETIVDGALMNSARVVDAIAELITTHRVKTKIAAVAISGHPVIIKKIPLPQMTADELQESIQREAEQFIPFDIADVNLDVQIVNTESAQKGQMDVVLVAAKRDYVNEYTSIIAEAGLDPAVVDVDAFAVSNMFETNYDVVPSETVALVNLGAAKTNINIIAKGISCFTRDLTMGGNTFTEELQRQLSISREEAEALKRNDARPAASDTVVTGAPNPQQVHRLLQQIAESVTTEIQRSIDFYAATSTDAPPSKVCLAGGTARLAALHHTMQERLGIPVEVADPFRRIMVPDEYRDAVEAAGPSAAVAVGLALRYPGDA